MADLETVHATIDHTGLPGVAAGGTGVVVAGPVKRTAADVTVTGTTPVNLDTALDLVLAAMAGDVIEVGVSAWWGTGVGGACLDVATIVSAAVVNYFSSGTSTPAAGGVQAWGVKGADTDIPISGAMRYVVQAGDISGGTVTLRARVFMAGANTKVLRGDTARPFTWWATNLG